MADMHEQLAAMLQGDAQAGSIRAQLAHELAKAHVANQPDAEKPEEISDLLAKHGFEQQGDNYAHPSGEIVEIHPHGWTYHAPNEEGELEPVASGDGIHDLKPVLEEEKTEIEGPSVRDQLEQASKDDTKSDVEAPSVKGQTSANAAAVRPPSLTPKDSAHISALASGDTKKEHFIRSAAAEHHPEDIADDLASKLIEHGENSDEPSEHDELAQHLLDTHSVPEMLARRFDIEPDEMAKVYPAPNAAKSRPTQ